MSNKDKSCLTCARVTREDGYWVCSLAAAEAAKMNYSTHHYCSNQRSTGWFMTRLLGGCGAEGRFYAPRSVPLTDTDDLQ